jgi:hypothetical protein
MKQRLIALLILTIIAWIVLLWCIATIVYVI